MCCSQMEQSRVFCIADTASEKEETQSAKRRKVGGQRPHKSAMCVTSYKPCTYCGLNLASNLDVGKKDNTKRHWALEHTADLCRELGVNIDTEDEPVSPKDFMAHLDKVDRVYISLNSHNYKLIPACNFFEIT